MSLGFTEHRRPRGATAMSVALWVAVVLCALSVGLNAMRVYGPPSFRAVIQCRNPKVAFGTVSEGEQLSQTFDIENVGGLPLILHSVITSCSCTQVHPTEFPVELRPGESLPLTVVLDTSGKQGALSAAIGVRCNDPNTPLFKLKMTTQVEPVRQDVTSASG
jgi:hypothetical protein